MACQLKQKDVLQTYTCVKCSYCSIQEIENYLIPLGYTAGYYGWNADIFYLCGSIVLVTGYRPFGQLSLFETEEDRKTYKELCDKLQHMNDRDEKRKLIEDTLYNLIRPKISKHWHLDD